MAILDFFPLPEVAAGISNNYGRVNWIWNIFSRMNNGTKRAVADFFLLYFGNNPRRKKWRNDELFLENKILPEISRDLISDTFLLSIVIVST